MRWHDRLQKESWRNCSKYVFAQAGYLHNTSLMKPSLSLLNLVCVTFSSGCIIDGCYLSMVVLELHPESLLIEINGEGAQDTAATSPGADQAFKYIEINSSKI